MSSMPTKFYKIPCSGLKGVATDGLTDWLTDGSKTLYPSQLHCLKLTCLYSQRFEKWSPTSHERLWGDLLAQWQLTCSASLLFLFKYKHKLDKKHANQYMIPLK